MYGDVKAKLRGLRHVYVQYLGTPSKPLELYTFYNNRECLHCHLGGRSFEENENHTKEAQMLQQIKNNQMSCATTDCHNIVHRVDQLKEQKFWQGWTLNTTLTRLERCLRLAGYLLIVGWLVELVTLHWAHPTAFLFFALLGGSLMGLGILSYLLALVTDTEPSREG